MKLYTEEQAKYFFECGRNFQMNSEITFKIAQEETTPIKLPSDEEIEKYIQTFPYTKHLDDGQYNDGVIVGAELAIEWMKNKIQGGNK
jgi:hypothetical protein